MNRRFILTLILVLACLFLMRQNDTQAEIIYLKDGQVIKGAIIYEDKNIVKVKTEYMTRVMKRNNIQRVLYGDRDMEQIYILLKNGSIIKGFLVDQDAVKVIYRKKKDSTTEETLLKENISQLSREEIKLLDPGAYIKTGIFIPLNPEKSKVGPAPIFIGGATMNLVWIKNMRVFFELGYVRSTGKDNKELYIQTIPFSFGLLYPIKEGAFTISPRIGLGMAIVDFNNAEGDTFRGFDIIGTAGLKGSYELIAKHLSVDAHVDYMVLIEKEFQLHNIMLSAGFSYRF